MEGSRVTELALAAAAWEAEGLVLRGGQKVEVMEAVAGQAMVAAVRVAWVAVDCRQVEDKLIVDESMNVCRQ